MLAKRSLSAPGCCRTKPLLKPSRQQQKQNPPPTTNTPITEHIESLVLALITTINTRDFNPANPLIDPQFTGSIRYPWGGREPTSWTGTLAIFAALTQQFPNYAIVRPMMYTEIYGDSNIYAGVGRPRKKGAEEGRYADVFVNFDVEGTGEGVVRQSVGIWRFRKGDGGEWRCFSLQSLDGCGRCDGLGGLGEFVVEG